MEKKYFWASYITDSFKGIFGKCYLNHSESNHDSAQKIIILNIDGIHGAMQELMKGQKS